VSQQSPGQKSAPSESIVEGDQIPIGKPVTKGVPAEEADYYF
jgi:hypothetical protein